ncbi:hypothetical protein [Halorientalis pallida]|uniref:Uncharacterized protein n=1 Tax=Halorientalis pallida TaxID=2479928 RepID=A0A498L1Q7_9EURY|nr:hypothetical protein [Halorientalis pallida]RXK49291.1 hypothetical protein EAF64_10255 [Halorientalis pallida]
MNRRQYLQAIGIGVATTGVSGVASAGTSDLGLSDGLNTTLTTTGQTSDLEERAAVACGGATGVTGTIVASDGCEEPAVADVSLTDGTLRLVLETVDDTGGVTVCTQALVGHEYVVTVAGYDETPDEVVVVHDGTEVTKESCDGGAGDVFVTTGAGSEIENSADAICGGVPVVRGTIVASDGCSVPRLADVSGSDGTVRFEAVTERPDDADVCTRKIVSHDYLAAAPDLADAPEEIVVVHDGETVTERTCLTGDGDDGGSGGPFDRLPGGA